MILPSLVSSDAAKRASSICRLLCCGGRLLLLLLLRRLAIKAVVRRSPFVRPLAAAGKRGTLLRDRHVFQRLKFDVNGPTPFAYLPKVALKAVKAFFGGKPPI